MKLAPLLLFAALALASEYTPDRVLATSVSALTFRAGNWVARARSPTVPALRCTGEHCGEADPDSVQCTNSGTGDDGLPQWKCEASLREGYSLAWTSVICEGYDRPGDTHMRRGSCSLDYRIKKTRPEPAARVDGPPRAAPASETSDAAVVAVMFLALAVCLVAVMSFKATLFGDARPVPVYPAPVYVAPPAYAPAPVYVSSGWTSGFFAGSLFNRSPAATVHHHHHSPPAAARSSSPQSASTSTSYSGTTML